MFRESLLLSDLCTADGVPVVWIARLIGVPIKERVAGSDLFDALKADHASETPLKVFFFGGADGVAATACDALNNAKGGLSCAGSLFPGFGSIEAMSRDDVIDEINSSGADFLVVSLGAQKGQLWLQHNHGRLQVPVRAHLGAVLNFEAATVMRAPFLMRRFGLEWLWRIKEEPHLWRRYWNDGCALILLLFTRVLPLAVWMWRLQLSYRIRGSELTITQAADDNSIRISLNGFVVAHDVDKVIAVFRDVLATKKQITIDFSELRAADARFMGLLLMLRKILRGRGVSPICVGLSPKLKRIFRLNGLDFLMSSENGPRI